MAVINLPAELALQIVSWQLGQQRYDTTEQSDGNGHTATRLGAPPRWRLRLGSVPALLAADAARWKATALALRGRINHLAVWDITNPVPRGTARGSITLAASAAVGATSVQLTGITPSTGTLEAGDWLQLGTGVGSHYCMVMAPAVAVAGAATISIEPPTRQAIASGTAVAWDKPLAHYKLTTDSQAWQGVPGTTDVGGFSFELLEDWRA